MKRAGIIFFSLLFLSSGIVHLLKPDVFLGLIPSDWPSREALNLMAGVAEIFLGIGFWVPRSRRASGILICCMLCLFWVLHGVHLFYPPKPEWPLWVYVVRFALQPVLIILVWKLKDFRKIV